MASNSVIGKSYVIDLISPHCRSRPDCPGCWTCYTLTFNLRRVLGTGGQISCSETSETSLSLDLLCQFLGIANSFSKMHANILQMVTNNLYVPPQKMPILKTKEKHIHSSFVNPTKIFGTISSVPGDKFYCVHIPLLVFFSANLFDWKRIKCSLLASSVVSGNLNGFVSRAGLLQLLHVVVYTTDSVFP